MADIPDILEFFAVMVPLGLGRTPPVLLQNIPDDERSCRDPAVQRAMAQQDALAGIWAGIMGDIPLEELLQAQAAYLRSPGGKWWPTPAEIRQLCPSVARAQLAETPRDLWPAVLRACGSATPGADLRRYVDSYAGGISDGEWAQVQRALDAAGGVAGIKALTSDFDRSKAGERFRVAVDAQAQPEGVIRLDEARRRRLEGRSDMRRIGGRE